MDRNKTRERQVASFLRKFGFNPMKGEVAVSSPDSVSRPKVPKGAGVEGVESYRTGWSV